MLLKFVFLLLFVISSVFQGVESKADCYLKSLSESQVKHNSTRRICKSGYFQLPDIFEDEQFDVNEINAKKSGFAKAVYCCPSETSEERLGSKGQVFFWPSELKGTLSRAFMICHPAQIPGLDSIRFLLYTKKTLGLFDYKEIYFNDSASIDKSGFMKDAPVKIVIHGFMSSAFVGPVPAIRAGFAGIPEKINIIAVHWEALANLITASDGICYDIAAKSTKFVGRKTARMIEFLIENNYTSLDKIHVLGHSLGCHGAGFVGKFLKIGRLPRISAFDPARPHFEGQPASERLDISDAEFVDVIHTATKQWKLLGTLSFGFLPFPVGIKAPIGHSDYYPNLGTHQPGCYLQLKKLPALCSHSRSYFYYADSVKYRHERLFLSTECNTLEDVEKGTCGGNDNLNSSEDFPKDKYKRNIMGEYTEIDNSTRKIFYLKTNSRSPFPMTLIKS